MVVVLVVEGGLGRGGVVRLGGLLVAGGGVVVTGGGVVSVGSGASAGRVLGTGNGRRLVSTTGDESPELDSSFGPQPSTHSATAVAPTASAPVRRRRGCNDLAPLDSTR